MNLSRYFLCLFLVAEVASDCIITKNSTKRWIDVNQCEHRYRCSKKKVEVEEGSMVHRCTNINDTEEIRLQLHSVVENTIYVEQMEISDLEPNEDSWRNLTEFYVRHSEVEHIVPGFFTKFNDLKVLEITDCKLKKIIDGVFSALTALTTLNISRNAIEVLAEHSFSGLINLKILDVSENSIRSIEPNIFSYQPFLTFIDISNNELTIANDLFQIPYAHTILLSGNKIETVNFDQFISCRTLEKVDLSANVIRNVTDLDQIYVTYLDLSDNQIKELRGIKHIENINMSNNHLVDLNKDIFSSELEALDVSHNEIATIERDVFEHTPNLVLLRLDHNNITNISNGAFSNLPLLRQLSVADNKLKQIPFGLLSNLDNLVYLDVSNNDLEFDLNTVSTLRNLKELHFSNTKIKNFDAEVLLTRFKKLEIVTISENVLTCDQLAYAIHMFQINKVHISKGSSTDTSNILGITCLDNIELKEQRIEFSGKSLSSSNDDNKLNNNVDNNSDNATFEVWKSVLEQQRVSFNKSLSRMYENIQDQNAYLNKSLSALLDKFDDSNRNRDALLNKSLADGFGILMYALQNERMAISKQYDTILKNTNYKVTSESASVDNPNIEMSLKYIEQSKAFDEYVIVGLVIFNLSICIGAYYLYYNYVKSKKRQQGGLLLNNFESVL